LFIKKTPSIPELKGSDFNGVFNPDAGSLSGRGEVGHGDEGGSPCIKALFGGKDAETEGHGQIPQPDALKTVGWWRNMKK